ncbi:unnamed protein product [Aphanomyces euteiches]
MLLQNVQDSAESENYTFKFPAGLLVTTTFGQPAILLLEKALYCDAFEKGVVPDDCFFAGHSLGEYGAVISFTDFLTTAEVAELVFLHALITNQAVERDSRGLSGYGMLAANPSRVEKQFDESKFEDLVNLVEATSDGNLCQIVNFNVVDSQYVVAGGLVNLEVLTHTLNYLKENAETSAKAFGPDTWISDDPIGRYRRSISFKAIVVECALDSDVVILYDQESQRIS